MWSFLTHFDNLRSREKRFHSFEWSLCLAQIERYDGQIAASSEKHEMSQAMSAHGEATAPADSAPEKPVKNAVELALDERLALTKFLITMSTEW